MKEVTAYQVGTLVFPTIQQAQQNELLTLIAGDKAPSDAEQKATLWMVTHVDEVVAILTCQPKKKTTRKPRCDIGTKRAKKDGTPAVL